MNKIELLEAQLAMEQAAETFRADKSDPKAKAAMQEARHAYRVLRDEAKEPVKDGDARVKATPAAATAKAQKVGG